jgi:hypothetical protein
MNSNIRTRTLGWIAAVWSAIVAVVLVWQTVEYRGVVAWLAEWQFSTFDRFFPVATIAILTAILTLPFVVMITLRLRRASRNLELGGQSNLLQRATIVSVFLKAGIGASALAAVALFGLGLSQGSIAEKPVNLKLSALSSPSDDLPIADGRVKLRATVLLDRLGFYKEGFLFTSRELWVAPVVTDIADDEFATFVQVERSKAGNPEALQVVGYLKKKSVPGGLAKLYANSGYSVSQKPNLIYADLRSARWPYWSAAADFAVLLLLLTVAAIFHNRYRKKMSA